MANKPFGKLHGCTQEEADIIVPPMLAKIDELLLNLGEQKKTLLELRRTLTIAQLEPKVTKGPYSTRVTWGPSTYHPWVAGRFEIKHADGKTSVPMTRVPHTLWPEKERDAYLRWVKSKSKRMAQNRQVTGQTT